MDRRAYSASAINPPRDDTSGINFIMGGPNAPNFRRRGRGPFTVESLVGWLSVKTVRKGRGVWVTPDRHHPLEEGFCLVLNDGQSYGFELAVDEPVETFCAFFRPGFVGEAIRAASLGDEALLDEPEPTLDAEPLFLERTHPIAPGLNHALAPLYRQAARGEVESLAWDGAFADLALGLIKERAPLAEGLAPGAARRSTRVELTRRLGRALDYLHGNLDRSASLADLADVAALSPHHFHRLFRQATGRTPHGYLTELRLARAARLLARTRLPVTEICASAGFSSLGSFSALFRRRFGLSPAAWRNAQD